MPKRLLAALALATILAGAAAAQGLGTAAPLSPALGALLEPDREAGKDRDQTLPARCCRVCKKGIPCGNGCISASKTCRKGPGCAC